MKFDVNMKDSTFKDKGAREELIQRVAWRLVRSAEDKLTGPKRGQERLAWCMWRLEQDFPEIGSRSEEYARAAYIHFKTETAA